MLTPIALTGRKEGKLLGGLCAVQEWMDLHENREPVLGILQFDKSQLHWVVIVGSQYHQRDEKYVLSNLFSIRGLKPPASSRSASAVRMRKLEE